MRWRTARNHAKSKAIKVARRRKAAIKHLRYAKMYGAGWPRLEDMARSFKRLGVTARMASISFRELERRMLALKAKGVNFG